MNTKVRSYTLTDTGYCEVQNSTVTSYNLSGMVPYDLTNADTGNRTSVSLESLSQRLVTLNDCTIEELSVKNKMITKFFAPDPHTDMHTLQQKLQYRLAGKIPKAPILGRHAYRGGITDVYREPHTSETFVEILYEDLDTETLSFEQLLEQVAFDDDHRKNRRLAELTNTHRMRRGRTLERTPAEGVWRARRQMKRRHGPSRQRCAHKRTRKDDLATTTEAENRARLSTAPRPGDWSSAGFFPATRATKDRGGGHRGTTPNGGGPGLPSGIAGDYG